MHATLELVKHIQMYPPWSIYLPKYIHNTWAKSLWRGISSKITVRDRVTNYACNDIFSRMHEGALMNNLPLIKINTFNRKIAVQRCSACGCHWEDSLQNQCSCYRQVKRFGKPNHWNVDPLICCCKHLLGHPVHFPPHHDCNLRSMYNDVT